MKNLNYKSELFFSNLIDSMPGFVFLKDCESKYVLVNKAFCRIADRELAKIEGEIDASMPWERYSESIIKMDQHIFLTREPQKYIEPTCLANKKPYTFFTRKFPIKNEEGNLIGLLGQCTLLADPDILKKTVLLKKNDLEEFGIFPSCYDIKDVIPNLTKRESIFLFHYIRGKSTREIATLLTLSIRTIEHYLERVKIKLNCKNKSELIEKAFINGYIYIIPVEHFTQP